MFKAIIDEHTYLAILQPQHAEPLFQLIDASRESIGQWLAFPPLTNEVQDTRSFIERSLARFAANNGYWAGIWHQGELAGSIGYLYIDWSSAKTEIGYWLGAKYEGLGLATKACRLLIDHAFNDLALNKVEINAAANNVKSRAIPIRLGFTEEGVIRQYERLNSEYLDRVVYGMLQVEWP